MKKENANHLMDIIKIKIYPFPFYLVADIILIKGRISKFNLILTKKNASMMIKITLFNCKVIKISFIYKMFSISIL